MEFPGFLFSFLLALVPPAAAFPHYVECDLSSSAGAANVMTATSLMGSAPNDVSDIIDVDTTEFGDGTTVTVTLENMQDGGFVHVSDGTLSGGSWTAKCDDRVLHKTDSLTSSDFVLTWTAPALASSVEKVTISVGTAPGYSVVKRQQLELTNPNYDSAASLAPSVAPAPSAAPEEFSCESDDPAYTFKYTFSDLGVSFYWKVTTDKLNAKITSDAGGWGKHL